VREPGWWETFFDEDWADVYPLVVPEEQTQDDIEAAVALLGLERGARLLDVPCCDGRLALPLAERGLRVTGVDLSARFIERARGSASEREVDVTLEQRDMRELPWREEFDAALCVWGSFGYFDEDGNTAFLRAIRRALRPGGRFLLATHVAETLFRIFDERGWQQYGDTLMLEERRWDAYAGRVDTEWTFVRHGTSSISRSSIRVYTVRELRALLGACGFVSVDAFQAPGRPFTFGARRLLAVATA
jgi:SAM-dependent methyltransferase